MDYFISQGFGGLVIRPGREMTPGFLSDEFFSLFEFTLSYAKAKNIQIKFAENFLSDPSSPFNNYVQQKTSLRAQKLVLDSIVNPSETADTIIHLYHGINSFVIAVPIKEHLLTIADSKIISCKDQESPVLTWKAQPGEWRLFVLHKEFALDMKGLFIPDTFNQTVMDTYIAMTLDPLHKQISAYSPGVFTGMMCEIPIIKPCDNTIPWHDDLVTKYKAKHKKDLYKLLPALFSENCHHVQKIRASIYSFLFETSFEQFITPMEQWFEKNNLVAWTILPDKNAKNSGDFLFPLNVPAEINLKHCSLQNSEGTIKNFIPLKVFSDLSNSNNQNESITILGRNRTGWANTLQTLKNEFDVSIFCNSNKTVIDGLYFNADQQGISQAPFSPGLFTPEGSYLKKLCDYTTHVQDMLKNVKWNRQIAVLDPTAEILSEYLPNNDTHAQKGNSALQRTIALLSQLSFSFDILSEKTLIESAINENGTFDLNCAHSKGAYSILLIPFAPFISKTFFGFIDKLSSNNCKILFVDHAPLGTTDDGISSTFTNKLDKMFDSRKDKIQVIPSDLLEEILSNIDSPVMLEVNNSRLSDIFVKHGSIDETDVFVFHNTSDSKDFQIQAMLPEHKHFALFDGDSGELLNLDTFEKEDNTCVFLMNFSPLSTYIILGGPTKHSNVNYNKDTSIKGCPFLLQPRGYRIVFKEQWNFETISLNSLPLSNWNVRIGLSRETGSISHYYETTFQTKSIPSKCFLVLNSLPDNSYKTREIDENVEITVNGTKIDRVTDFGIADVTNPTLSNTTSLMNHSNDFLPMLFKSNYLVFSINPTLIKGANRISIKTIGNNAHPQVMHFSPLLLGDFTIAKGPNGWAIDKIGIVAGSSSWTKNGFPYLTGVGSYKQSFEIPNEYSKLILRISQVSGTTAINLNDKPLGIFNWHPIEIDITSLCSSKRNELTIYVMNTVDNIIKLSGRPSGLTGEVHLDVY
jgi:hypothetical protein